MKIGYARVSTHEQTTEQQVTALKAYGCEKVYIDEGVSGAKTSRPELDKALADLRKGDTLVVWKLDRLGRRTTHLCELIEQFEKEGKGFASITDGMDTTTPAGKLIFRIMAAVAENERDLIRQRTVAGLERARAEGKVGGRPKKHVGIARRVKALVDSGEMNVKDACKQFNIGTSTYYRDLQKIKDEESLKEGK